MKPTLCSSTNAVLYEHVFKSLSDPSKRACIVNTNPNTDEKLDGYEYAYRAYAHPSRANYFNAINVQSLLIIEE